VSWLLPIRPARSRARVALGVLAACLVAAPAAADVDLVLDDGQVLSGRDVELKDGQYLLELATGSVVALPLEVVRELRLRGEKPDRESTRSEAPSGLRHAEPEVLAGPPEPIPFPGRTEQLAAFRGGESRFARNVIDPFWQPRDGWLRPGNIGFNPARWYQAPIDATWTPQPAYTVDSDVTNFSPVEWSKGALDPTWYPEDGFARRARWVGRYQSPFASWFGVTDDDTDSDAADE
jgi:hypothetical protein